MTIVVVRACHATQDQRGGKHRQHQRRQQSLVPSDHRGGNLTEANLLSSHGLQWRRGPPREVMPTRPASPEHFR